MEFDVVIGNPPYQKVTGGGNQDKGALPVYQKFVQQAKRLNPRRMSFLIPARWLTGDGRGLDAFRTETLSDRRVRTLRDFPFSRDVFSTVDVMGGVLWFAWERDLPGDCDVATVVGGEEVSRSTRPLLLDGMDTMVRRAEAVPIVQRVRAMGEPTVSSIVSLRRPFGIRTNFQGRCSGSVLLYQTHSTSYVEPEDLKRGFEWLDAHKVLMPEACGENNSETPEKPSKRVLAQPIYARPGTACTETYVCLGPFDDEAHARNFMAYMCTRFFRFMVLQKKSTQHAMAKAYSLVPLLDTSKAWTDPELYDRYGITRQEVSFIESQVRPMELQDRR
jgi:site-specific DNA-methyltransferase (adenine-specific)